MSCPLDGAARTTEEPPAHAAGARRTVLGLEPRFIAIGIAGGILSGLLGVGGGIVMVPLLVLWAAYGQRDAHALSLGAIIPISLASVITYARKPDGSVNFAFFPTLDQLFMNGIKLIGF